MVKFGGKIGTLYQMLKNAFKKNPLQNRTDVQNQGGRVKGFLNNVKKNCRSGTVATVNLSFAQAVVLLWL